MEFKMAYRGYSISHLVVKYWLLKTHFTCACTFIHYDYDYYYYCYYLSFTIGPLLPKWRRCDVTMYKTPPTTITVTYWLIRETGGRTPTGPGTAPPGCPRTCSGYRRSAAAFGRLGSRRQVAGRTRPSRSPRTV